MDIIVTTQEQLKAALHEMMGELLPRLHESKPFNERMPISEVVQYMNRQGYITTVPSVYTLVSKGRIPYEKVNGKLIFSRTAIDGWIKSQVKK